MGPGIRRRASTGQRGGGRIRPDTCRSAIIKPPPAPLPSCAQRTLLLVDDSPDILAALNLLLREQGRRILTAGSAAEGLRLLELNDVDVVISDLHLGSVSGVEFLLLVKARRPDTPCMLLSGDQMPSPVAAAISSGSIYKYLTKPWNNAHLRETVREAFSIHAGADNEPNKAIKLLLVEDSEDDADLEMQSLRRAGFELQYERVDTAAAMDAALKKQTWDAVISDFIIPGFSGLEALRRVRASGLDIPFILVSGRVGDETAAQAMRAGASDYVFKDNLTRLAPALARELKEVKVRTAQRQAQADLLDSEARFRSLTAVSSDWYWEQDEEYRFVRFSGGDQIDGWSTEQARTLGLRRWELPEVAPVGGSWNEHQAQLEARKPFHNFEYQRILGDGGLQHVAASGEPIFDASGRFTGYRGVATDITERKRAEEALAQFKQALDQTLDCVFMFRGGDFRFIYVNEGATKQMGYTEAEMLRMTPLDIKPEFTLERFRQLVQPLLDGAQPSLLFQTVHRHKDGHDFPVEISLQYLPNESRASRFVAIVRDITERKRTERLMQQITEGTASTTGEEFMRTITRILAEALGVRYAFVGEFTGSARDRVKVLSFWNGLEHAEPFEFALEGTPCRIAAEEAECFFPGGVQDLFPQDDHLVRLGVECYLGIRLQSDKGEPLGLLTVMHTRKLENDALARSVMRIFAARAGAELARLQSTEALERSEQRFAKTFRSSPLAIVLTRLADGKVLDANEAATELFGYARREMLGRVTSELGFWIDASDRERTMEVLRTTGAVQGLEHPIRRKSGDTRVVQNWMERIELEGEQCILGSLLDVTEARHASEALRNSEMQMRLMAENLPAMIVYFDRDCRVRYANRRYAEFFAGAGADVLGWHLRQVLGEAYWATIEERIARVLAGEPAAYEREMVRADGEPRKVALNIVPHRAEGGEILGAYALALDITEHKRAEKKLRKRDTQLSLLTENIPAAVAYIDRDRVIQVANRRYVELHCRAGVEVVGRHVRDVVGEKAWPEVEKHGSRVLTGESLAYQRVLERADGERREIEVHLAPDRSPGGKVRGYYSFAVDATDRKRTEEASRRFRVALDNSADLILLIDRASMRYVDVNETTCRLLGYSREELARMGPQDVLPVSREELERSYDELIANPTVAGSLSSHYRCKDGSSLFFESTRHVMRSGDGYLIVAISRDVRERYTAEQNLRESEERFRSLTELSSDWYWEQDEKFRFIDMQNAPTGLSPLRARGYVGRTRWEAHADCLAPEQWAAHRRQVEAHLPFRDLEYARPSQDGCLRWVSISGLPIIDRDGRFKGYRGIGKDISDRKQAEEALRLRDRALDASVNAVMITDASCKGNPIVYVNPAFERNTGYSAAEALGRNPGFLHGTDTDQPAIAALRTAIEESGEASALLRNYRKDGTQFWNELRIAPVRDPEGRVTHFVGVQNDVTERVRYQAELERQANFDSLTGLANRNLLADRLRQTIVSVERAGRIGAVLFLDLDRFKVINDGLGHEMGDRVLTQIGWRLSEAVRGGDTVARSGGDEFVVVLADLAREEDAAIIAQKLLDIVASPLPIEGHDFLISTSIGVALFPADGADPETLLKHADVALYRSKEKGRGCVAFFAQEMNDRAVNYFNLERDLRGALVRGEFMLHYQPIIEMVSGEIVGAEALIRWRQESGRMVSPLDFIPIAEESGLIVPIGAWVLREATTRAREWNADGRRQLSVAVNLSARQFRDPKLVDMVRDALTETGLDPHLLHIEITESTVMQNAEDAIAAMLALREIGVSLSVDDFGTGYSSLSYLKRLPLNHLKVDRSFVKDIPASRDDMAITRAVIELAHSLELQVVAEGVETEEQREFLLGQGCDYAQGYLFSKPVEAQAFHGLVNERGVQRERGTCPAVRSTIPGETHA